MYSLTRNIVLHEIIPHLDTESFFSNFARLLTWDNTKNTWQLKVEKRLENLFGDDVDIFFRFLETNNVVLTGSYIVQCIRDDVYTNSDIDLLIPSMCSKSIIQDFTTKLHLIQGMRTDTGPSDYSNKLNIVDIQDWEYLLTKKRQVNDVSEIASPCDNPTTPP